MCGENYFRYYVGEKRELGGRVAPEIAGETVVITSARYEIKKRYTDEIITKGNCEFEGDEFSAMLSFDEPGDYVFTVYLKVGAEEPVEKADICVLG